MSCYASRLGGETRPRRNSIINSIGKLIVKGGERLIVSSLEQLKKDFVTEVKKQMVIDDLVKEGIYDRNLSPEQARKNFINLNLLFALPEITIKPATIASNISKVKQTIQVSAERLFHIFGKAEHNLGALVTKFGSEEKAFEAVQTAANQALKEGKLTPNSKGILPSGDKGNIIDVGGMEVRLIGGKVENGQVTISSFSRKRL